MVTGNGVDGDGLQDPIPFLWLRGKTGDDEADAEDKVSALEVGCLAGFDGGGACLHSRVAAGGELELEWVNTELGQEVGKEEEETFLRASHGGRGSRGEARELAAAGSSEGDEGGECVALARGGEMLRKGEGVGGDARRA